MGTWQVWPFAVAPHPNAGYRSILVPPFLTDLGLARNVMFVFTPVANREDVETPVGEVWLLPLQSAAGSFFAVYRTRYARNSDDAYLTDSAGRLTPLTTGVLGFDSTDPLPEALAVSAAAVSFGVANEAFEAFWTDQSIQAWPKSSEPFELTAAGQPELESLHITRFESVTLTAIRSDELVIEIEQGERAGLWTNQIAREAPTSLSTVDDGEDHVAIPETGSEDGLVDVPPKSRRRLVPIMVVLAILVGVAAAASVFLLTWWRLRSRP